MVKRVAYLVRASLHADWLTASVRVRQHFHYLHGFLGGRGGGGHYTFCKQLYFFGVKTVKQLEPICLWEILLSLCVFY